MGRDLDCMADVLMGFHRSTFSKPTHNLIIYLVFSHFISAPVGDSVKWRSLILFVNFTLISLWEQNNAHETMITSDDR
jgi:hypothetical protein